MKSKILKITGVTLLLFAGFIWSAPWLFKGKITRMAKARMNMDLRAHVNFSGVDISLFHHFPKISIGLDSLQVTCVGEFQGDTLMTARQLDIACDIGSLISGDSIRVSSITVNEPRVHALVHADGHSNWNILKSDSYPGEYSDSTSRIFKLALQRYAIHKGYVEYLNEKNDVHIVINNLEHEGRGDFNSELFNLKTKTRADAIQISQGGTIPYGLTAKANIDMTFRVDNRTHTFTFNTDQVSFNDMKLHTEGFFQWINDSSYNMHIKYKVPSTEFKKILSMLPSVYRKDFASIETNGQVNFNGFIKGKYDGKHFPAYHANLYVLNGYFKYPDLPVAVEKINLGVQADNPDGIADHAVINISGLHAEMNSDNVDLHLMIKNPESHPFIDFGFTGSLDLANISKWMKLEPGTSLTGLLKADVYGKGNIPQAEIHKKDPFQSGGNIDLTDFSYASNAYPGGIDLNQLLITFNPKNILVKELKGEYLTTHIAASGTVNNFYDFALRRKPLNASIDLKADEFNLREWVGTAHHVQGSSIAYANTTFAVPDYIDFSINASADKLHYDNLDLQNLSCKLLISNQAVKLHDLRANGLDGDIVMEGEYSTLESRDNPEINMTYDVKGLDIQKTFFAFNTVRKIMPVAKFMSGNLNAHMTLSGRLRDDMTTDPATLQGAGTVQVLAGTLKDFGALDKLSQSLDIVVLKDIPLKDVKADFTFKTGRVEVSPFLVHGNDLDMVIGGAHGFDQSLDYDVIMKVKRSQLGSKGSTFVKNVVEQAADKGVPVKLRDAVTMNVKVCGSINGPDVRTDMDAMVSNAATDLEKEVNDFVNAKLDSAKEQLHPAAPAKKPIMVKTAYKSRTHAKTKKKTKTTHKSTVHSKSKKKKPVKNYTISLKKGKSVASNLNRK
jgi:AsmA-like C-terminal region